MYIDYFMLIFKISLEGSEVRNCAIFGEVVGDRAGNPRKSCLHQSSDCQSIESHAEEFTTWGRGEL